MNAAFMRGRLGRVLAAAAGPCRRAVDFLFCGVRVGAAAGFDLLGLRHQNIIVITGHFVVSGPAVCSGYAAAVLSLAVEDRRVGDCVFPIPAPSVCPVFHAVVVLNRIILDFHGAVKTIPDRKLLPAPQIYHIGHKRSRRIKDLKTGQLRDKIMNEQIPVDVFRQRYPVEDRRIVLIQTEYR